MCVYWCVYWCVVCVGVCVCIACMLREGMCVHCVCVFTVFADVGLLVYTDMFVWVDSVLRAEIMIVCACVWVGLKCVECAELLPW